MIIKEFQQKLAKAMQEDGRTSWEQGDYSFRFSYAKEGGVYKWKGERLRISPREAYYLYQRLVLGLSAGRAHCATALYVMRSRYGLEFLRDVLGGGESRRGPAWEWDDGIWRKKRGRSEQAGKPAPDQKDESAQIPDE
jgi:hypothetical protein